VDLATMPNIYHQNDEHVVSYGINHSIGANPDA
jgi:hypothetical protein